MTRLVQYSPEHMDRLNAKAAAPSRRLKLSKSKRKAPRTSIRIVRDLMLAFDQTDMMVSELAAKLGNTDETIKNWRHGHSMPQLDQLEAMAQVLGYRLVVVPEPSAEPVVHSVD